MKRQRITFLIIIAITACSHVNLFGKDKRDSLKAILQRNPHDTIKIEVYQALHKQLMNEDTTLSLEYLRKAISLSEGLNDSSKLTRCYLNLASYYDLKGNLPAAKAALKEIESIIHNYYNVNIEAAFYMQRGIIFYFEGEYNKAVGDLWEALRRYEQLGDSITVGSCYLTIGTSNFQLENIDEALAFYQKALKIYENSGYESGVAMAMGNIGLIYKNQKKYELALENYQGSLSFHQKNDYPEDVMIDLANIGELYLEIANYPSALDYFKQSRDVAELINSQSGILNAIYNIASIESQSGYYQSAISNYKNVLEIATQLNFREFIKDTYYALADTYEKMGDYEPALQHRIVYESWKDSLINENHLNQVKELEIRYETAQKDNQISELAYRNELQEKETQRQSTIKKAFIGGFILITLLSGSIIYITHQRFKNQKLLAEKDKEIKEVNFRQQLSELEMKALRAQINPHFLYNCMNSINRMILEKENEMASQYLAKFSKLVRMILENSEKSMVPLKNELEMLEAYINLESLRFKGKINYTIYTDDSVDPDATYLPSMVLQPFVENAIWHGLMNKKNGDEGMIKIAIKEENDILNCTIEDNGIGREAAHELREKSVLKTKSMGMKITEERLKLIAKEDWERLIHIIDLKDPLNQAQGTRVEISIPLQPQT